MSLVDKIRKSREQRVEVGGHTFTVRRPTDVEMIELQGKGSIARMLPYVIGWEGVTQLDIIPGGDPHPQEFDAETCREWLSDRPDLLGPLVEQIMGLYHAHLTALGDAAKN
jgi:hypothetical protein